MCSETQSKSEFSIKLLIYQTPDETLFNLFNNIVYGMSGMLGFTLEKVHLVIHINGFGFYKDEWRH